MTTRQFFGFVLSASLLAVFAPPALAQAGPYIGLQGGVSLPTKTTVESESGGTAASGEVEFKDGPVGGIVAGYEFQNGLRPEIQVDYRRNNVKGGGLDTRAGSVTGNLYYNFFQQGYYFYVGGGGGYTRLRLGVDGIGGDSDNQPIYQVGTGAGFSATRHVQIGLDYRYQGTFSRAKFGYDVDGTPLNTGFNYRSSLVLLALRFSFGASGSAATSAVQGESEPVRVVPLQ